MTYPTNPYYDPAPISPPLVAGGTAATLTTSSEPAVFTVIAPLGALYDTTTSPLVINPSSPGALFFVANQQATSLRVGSSNTNDPGIVLAAGGSIFCTFQGGLIVLLAVISGAASPPLTARAVVTAALPAYTRSGGVITANAVGAPGNVFDGVTPVAGDVVLLQEGIAVAASDAGPYVVTQMGTAGLKLILTRPIWWPNGGFIVEGTKVRIQEGTIFKNTAWTTWVTTATVVIGISAPLMFPDRVILSQAPLVGGTVTITNVPIRDALLSNVIVTRKVAAGAGIANTVGYWPTVGGANGITPGAVGTASIVIEAVVAAGTKNATDTSSITIQIEN